MIGARPREMSLIKLNAFQWVKIKNMVPHGNFISSRGEDLLKHGPTKPAIPFKSASQEVNKLCV